MNTTEWVCVVFAAFFLGGAIASTAAAIGKGCGL